MGWLTKQQTTTLILAVKTIHPPSSTVQLFECTALPGHSILSQLFTLAYMENRTYFHKLSFASLQLKRLSAIVQLYIQR